MPDDRSPSVAVIGAAGFVGRELLRQLEPLGVKVTAVVRGLPELALDSNFHVACSQSTALAAGGFDVVVNLAYPTSGPPYENPDQNAAIGRLVEGLIKSNGHLIQVSTLAVFGLALDRAVSIGPVARVRDNAYVESKITAEHLFAKQQAARNLSLDIVRLGNVWGSGSGTWALPLVHRLLTQRPVGVAGASEHSNTTDVANAAAYLAFLIRAEGHEPGVRYHHLAEFSGVTWSEWVEPLAEAMGVEPVYADPAVLETPGSSLQEMAAAFEPVSPRSVYRKLSVERHMGSVMRTLVRQLPASARLRLKNDLVFAAAPNPDREEQAFLAIIAGGQEFISVVDPSWSPVLTKEQSLEGVLRWLDYDWSFHRGV